MKWLEDVWGDLDIRKVIDKKLWVKFLESVMGILESEEYWKKSPS